MKRSFEGAYICDALNFLFSSSWFYFILHSFVHLQFIHTCKAGMDPEDDDWWIEMRKYLLSAETLTIKVLRRIKRGRIRNNLPFDDAFQKFFLQKTNAR